MRQLAIGYRPGFFRTAEGFASVRIVRQGVIPPFGYRVRLVGWHRWHRFAHYALSIPFLFSLSVFPSL